MMQFFAFLAGTILGVIFLVAPTFVIMALEEVGRISRHQANKYIVVTTLLTLSIVTIILVTAIR